MIVIYGQVALSSEVGPSEAVENWEDCLQTCLETWDCLISLASETCPLISAGPPLFGNFTSSIVIQNSENQKYFKSEIETSDHATWNFNSGEWRCVEDFPEVTEPTIYDGIAEVYELNKMENGGVMGEIKTFFGTGETFLLKGTTYSNVPEENKRFMISFYDRNSKHSPLNIQVYINRTVDLATWMSSDNASYQVTHQNGPIGENQQFEMRVNSSETQVFIYFDGSLTYTYPIQEDDPMKNVTTFILNSDRIGGLDYLVLDYMGWTGECGFPETQESQDSDYQPFY